MNTTRKVAIGAVLVGGSLVGGAIGATLVGAAGAQSPSTTTVTVDPGAATTKHYNTDPAHEAGESPERQAEEAAHDAQVTTTTAG